MQNDVEDLFCLIVCVVNRLSQSSTIYEGGMDFSIGFPIGEAPKSPKFSLGKSPDPTRIRQGNPVIFLVIIE
jgi:hypothetical protein